MNIQYYLIHGVDKTRGPRMVNEFYRIRINPHLVKWILHSNKDELSQELINQLVVPYHSYSCGHIMYAGAMKLGQISCSYKHYLALKDIVENNYEYAVIMEDNMVFKDENVPTRMERCIRELNTYYQDWDIMFDYNYGTYTEHHVTPERLVYPKSNDLTDNDHGGTRCATFYLLNKKCAHVSIYQHWVVLPKSFEYSTYETNHSSTYQEHY